MGDKRLQSLPMSEQVSGGFSLLASDFCSLLTLPGAMLPLSYLPPHTRAGGGQLVAFSCPSHQPRAADIDGRHSRWASNLIKPEPGLHDMALLPGIRKEPAPW